MTTQAKAQTARPTHRPPLNVEQACEYLGTTDRHLRRLVQEKRVPYTRIGPRKLRFEPDKLDEWIAAHRVEPEPE